MARYMLILFAMLSLPPAAAGAADDPVTCRVNAIPRWLNFYTSIDGQYVGPIVDHITHVFRAAGIEPEFQIPKAKARVFRDLEAGTIDIVMIGSHMAERERKFDLSIPVSTETYGLVRLTGSRPVPIEEARIISFQSMRGMTAIAPFLASAGTVIELDSLERAMALLKQDKVDYFLGNVDNLPIFAEWAGIRLEDIEALAEPRTVSTTHIIFNRASPCAARLGAVNAALREKPFQP